MSTSILLLQLILQGEMKGWVQTIDIKKAHFCVECTLGHKCKHYNYATGRTSVAHFPALEIEHCEVVGMDCQIQLHCQNGLTIHFPRTEEVHSENYTQETNTNIRLNTNDKHSWLSDKIPMCE